MRRLILFSAIVLVGLFVGGEIFARLVLGLGTPPLSVRSDAYEYMFKPSQDVKRFGNRVVINEYGMRSDTAPQSDATKVILVFGDSVLNGGNLTDQNALATSILQDRLRASGEDVYVGNVSAGSWGPANMRGWLETYGDLGAETMIYVLSSHDWYDLPTFKPLDPMTHPVKPPASALLEGAQRYLPRFLPKFGAGEVVVPAPGVPMDEDGPNAREDLAWLLEYSAARGQRVCLVQHLTQSELKNGIQSGHEEISATFGSEQTRLILQDFMSASSVGRDMHYRDDIHISDEGQSALAKALGECVIDAQPVPTDSSL
jgi:hypothetical protein